MRAAHIVFVFVNGEGSFQLGRQCSLLPTVNSASLAAHRALHVSPTPQLVVLIQNLHFQLFSVHRYLNLDFEDEFSLEV